MGQKYENVLETSKTNFFPTMRTISLNLIKEMSIDIDGPKKQKSQGLKQDHFEGSNVLSPQRSTLDWLNLILNRAIIFWPNICLSSIFGK